MASSKDQEPQDPTSNGEGNTENDDKVEGNEQDGKNNDSKDTSSPGKIFIGGLSRDTTSETFTSHFGKYGELTDSVIMKDRHTGQPRGFGFVTYADPSVVDKVIKDKHVLNGKTVEIKRTIPRGNVTTKGPKTKKIFVGGIPISTTEDELKDYFSKYGKVVEHQIMQDRDTGRSRGFGFVTFDSEQVVEDILAQGKLHELGGKQVEIKKAEPKKPLPEAGPAYGIDSRGPYIAGGGGPYRDSYSGLGGGYISNLHRSVGGYGNRDGGYGGYGAAEFGRGYGGYGGSSLGGYGEDSSRGYGGRIGSYGGYGSGPFGSGGGGGMLGGYGGGIGGGYGAYGGSSYGGGFDSGIGGGYGGGGTYGSGRGGYGSSDGRYHPYAR